MRNIKCIAIDDEPFALEIISDYCDKIDYLELKGKFTNPFDALNLLRKDQIDLVFLDIQMPDLSGFSFVKSMKKAPLIVFTTAYKEYALESYDLNAVDYLLKPFSFERFFQAIEKINDRLSENTENVYNSEFETSSDFVFINYNNRIIKIEVDDIIYINSDGDYIFINTINHKYIIREKLKNISDKLNPNLFIRIHKSYIISLSKIDELYGNTVKCRDTEIPIGHLYRNNLIREIEKRKIG